MTEGKKKYKQTERYKEWESRYNARRWGKLKNDTDRLNAYHEKQNEKNRHYALMYKCLKARPDVKELLEALKTNGIKLPNYYAGKYRTIINILKEADATMDARKAINWLRLNA